MQQLASENAPSPSVVKPHFVYGGLIWLLITVLIVFFPEAFTQHYFNPKLLAITHLLVLGWITMIIFGALYQLVPVIMEVKLFSERLAYISFVFLAIGTILLAICFWQFWLGAPIHVAACCISISVLVFAINLFLTSNRSFKASIERNFIQTAIFWLLFTVIAGVALAINLTVPFLQTSHLELLKLHAHAGIIGWMLQLIVGVGSKLLPMFMVSHNLKKIKLQIAYYLINIGLLLGMVSLYFQLGNVVYISIFLVVTGVLSFISYLYEAYRKRIKKQLDIGMLQSKLSFLIIFIPILIIATTSFKNIAGQQVSVTLLIAYAGTILFGFVSSLIMGQMYKTLPFIVWLSVYRSQVGKMKIPFPKDLYSEKLAKYQLYFFVGGFGLLFLGIVAISEIIISVGGVILLLSVILFNINVFKIILHKPKSHE